ncbi:transposase [Telmatospirillum siberiense]|uniref:Transposase InsH N-terminal domain-containing protein n=1 Tax=Telmatospirillum siberiense TaxID=382514 RepID=A0A2N3Q004_9PROT|nr:transposase [Telmatospirillum siberiense]PKU25988.1 hypothetical protein CWS72_02260 [Telmatospirillum siberiense]
MAGDGVLLSDYLDPGHPLLSLSRTLDWPSLIADASRFSKSGRLMLGLYLLSIQRGLSDRALCEAWPENPYFQAFCGETVFCRQLDVTPEEMEDWRRSAGAANLESWAAIVASGDGEDGARTFVIDVDGVVATLTPGNDYRRARPLPDVIAAINRLYRRGHRIVMLTARGSATGLSWEDVTREQFERWGLLYHELRFGKPAADYYVDDRLIGVEMLCAMSLGRRFPPSTLAPRLSEADLASEHEDAVIGVCGNGAHGAPGGVENEKAGSARIIG